MGRCVRTLVDSVGIHSFAKMCLRISLALLLTTVDYKRNPSYVFERELCPEQPVPDSEAGTCSLSEWSAW